MSTITTLNDGISGASFRGQVNTNFANLNADKAELSGGTFTGDISVPDEAYGVGWNGSTEVPTKNALYDKIETISGGGSVATDSIWDAKGDLAVGTGANTASRLAVGTNGQILVADSAEATGVKWANASGGGDMLAATYDPANIAEQLVGLTATQTVSGKTLTAPKFVDNGFIADSNGNEMVSFNQNASAVNYLEIENGATGNPPHLRAMGDDTNIGLHLLGKGTGEVNVCDAADKTKRIRFQASGNSTGVITTLASSNTTSHTITLPNATDTLVGKATTDTLTNKTLTSPTFTTPVLGTPTSGTLTNCTGLPIAGLVSSTSTALGVGSLELGNASDTTLSRSAAGTLAVEGIRVKTTTPLVLSAASYTTDTGTSLNMDNLDIFIVTAQAGALLFNSPGGTLVQGRQLIIRIKDNGTARALTWNAIFRAMGTSLPSTTVLSKTLYLGFMYNSTDTKWDLIASAQEA